MSCITVFKDRGLKLTPQRRLIVNMIHDANGHITADQIIGYTQAKMPGVDKSTVYRTLDLLGEAGCVYKAKLGNEYIYHHEAEGHHHHLVCNHCGKIVDCDEDILTSVQRELIEKYDFCADFKHMVMSGVCRECRYRNS